MKSDAFSDYAAESGSAPGKQPITEEGSPKGQGDSIHIPAEFLQGQQFKAGDELVLKVLSADENGVEVEYAKAEGDAGGSGDEGMSANDEIDRMESA